MMVNRRSAAHFGALLLALLFSIFSTAVVAAAIPNCRALSGDFPPRCARNTVDPLSGETCTDYGYDCLWQVTDRKLPSGERRIEINGEWPPSIVKVQVGQRIRIELVNMLTDPEDVTIHFHGLLMKNGYVLMDGPQHITQAGVGQGKSFIYDFPTTQAGTYWIHSHAPGQYPKGLRLPLIITDPQDAGNYGYPASSEGDLDKIITLSDYWTDFWVTESLYQKGTCGGVGLEVPPEEQTFNEVIASPTGADTRQKILVTPGSKYRLRFINLGAHSRYYVWISGNQDMEIIEIDGVMLKRNQFSKGFEISSGQRVSVLVSLPTGTVAQRIMVVSDRRINKGQTGPAECMLKPTSSYSPMQYTWGWLSDSAGTGSYAFNEPSQSEMAGYGRLVKTWENEAKVAPFYQYRPKMEFTDQNRVGVDISKPCGKNNADYCLCDDHNNCLFNPSYAWNFSEVAFQPWKDQQALLPTKWTWDYIHEITLNDDKGLGVMGLRGKGVPFIAPDTQEKGMPKMGVLPQIPTLLRGLLGTSWDTSFDNPNLYGYNASQVDQTVVLPKKNEIHWFAFRTVKGDHPIHMHGHEFQIIAKVPVRTDPTTGRVFTFAEYGHTYNSIPHNTYPSRRDTIMVEKGSTVIVAIQADNPGVWALHCHNDFHAKTGMFMQIVEDIGALRERIGRFSTRYPPSSSLNPFWGWDVKMFDVGAVGLTQAGAWKVLYQTLRKTFESYGYSTAALPIQCNTATEDGSFVDMNCEDRPDFP
ncbi:multicopper oxidase [Amniculicola lignicola CBS 123094]|uniref:Multicopper oxidase n=1 Tax=Amniculicola lignicola CBS 123094 TaxID=1392246 RepID=A0A6A5W6U0_9PLEO|nr:multicopper oxidase [Amniculicola lignicola CBS 123094]